MERGAENFSAPRRAEKGENPLDGQRGKSVKGGRRAPLSRAVGNFFDFIEKVLQAVKSAHQAFDSLRGGKLFRPSLRLKTVLS